MKSFADAFTDRFGPPVKQHGGQLIFCCPTCAHKSLSANVVNGLYNCWSCGFSQKKGGKVEGTAGDYRETEIDRDLQRKMIRAVLDGWSLSNLHRGYLKKRGIFRPEKYKICTVPFDAVEQLITAFPKAHYEASGLINRDFETGKLRPAMCLEPRRILIPYWNGSEYITFKSRQNPFEFDEWDGWKYMSPRGSKVGSHLFYRVDFSSRDLLITEGELKALAALEAGFWTTAIPGIEFSKPVITELMALISRSRVQRAFIVLDNEPEIANHYPVLRSMYRLSEWLGNKACIVPLPKKAEHLKMDLDLFFSSHNANDLEDVLEDSWCKRSKTLSWVKERVKSLSRGR